MPFRHDFACLWCGRSWETRSDGDLEGWASLCPECLGKADQNGFLKGRLRAALRERSAAAGPTASELPAGQVSARTRASEVPTAPSPGDWEDWYLRRGGFARGPVYDGAWSMELDEVTRWVDDRDLSGVIVELGAGMGWWSGLLAERGELWLYDDDTASLDAARRRLMAHGLLAHLHQRDPLEPPDRRVDAVFAAYYLGRAETVAGLGARLDTVLAWLRPGGSFVFVEAATQAGGGSLSGPGGPLWPREAETLEGRCLAAGFARVAMGSTHSSFIFGEAFVPA